MRQGINTIPTRAAKGVNITAEFEAFDATTSEAVPASLASGNGRLVRLTVDDREFVVRIDHLRAAVEAVKEGER